MTRTHRRTGFTLVELMVAMSIAIILAGMTVGLVYSTGAATSQKVVGAADKVSGWLMVAKNRAVRDGNAQGVRFFINGNTITEAQYIEKPPKPFVPNPATDPNGARIVLVYNDANTNGIVEPTEKQVFYFPGNAPGGTGIFGGTVVAGDMLMLSEFGTAYRIDSFAGADTSISFGSISGMARQLTLGHPGVPDYPEAGAAHAPGGTPAHVTYGVAFQGQARPVFGEQTLQIGENTCIDYRTAPVTTLGVSAPAGFFDVLFSSSGQVHAATSTSITALWVRDPTKTGNPHDFPNAGEQVLVVIYPKTGSISTCLVNPNPADTHKFAYEGINAGL